MDSILENLNASQRAAVSSNAQTLAILAGPGSGKTHTLTSRTAWLLKSKGLQPSNVIVATFTVKAAREMKERIGKLIGDGLESKLILGTFHSIARRYLARYGHLIDVRRDFGIADSSDTLAIIKRIVKRHQLTINAAMARSRISSRKAKGAAMQEVGNSKAGAKPVEAQEFEICFTEYQEALNRSNLLDYDDLLLRCVDLLRAYPSCVSNVEAVLIDEFQDTNLVQFDLMRLFAAEKKRVTIVGDPDQSIYGFRSAETKNFKRMITQYPDTVTISLEENYRSSGAILLAALEVIQQDESRIAKSLMPTHTVGTRPVLRKLPSAHVEGQWIVTEIKRCLALTGKLMTFNDIAILLRSASLSRHIEGALGKSGIPYRMVGGHRFYDRVEVKILLDYMRVVSQPDNNDAFARIANVPSRRIGESTVKSLLEEADHSSSTLWNLVLQSVQGAKSTKTKLAKQTEQGLSSVVNIVLTAREKISDSKFSVVELIDYVIKKISFEDFLEKSYPDDHESRWANVQELSSLASDFCRKSDDDEDEKLPEVDGLVQDETSSPLSKFLANIALASDANVDEADSMDKTHVTISTIHSAKGLEWPVVFIPAAYEGSIPHSRAEDSDEERRLLYVAMTRAKALLYLSYPCKNSQQEQTTLSSFLTPRSLKPHLNDKGPSFKSSVTQSIGQILGRPPLAVDIEEAKVTLDSLEDDLWPVEGEEKDSNASKWGNWQGHHYTQGQQPPKRQRLDEIGNSSIISANEWRPSYKTTMAETKSFSAAATTLKIGFVSAASHMQILGEENDKCVADSHQETKASKSKGRLQGIKANSTCNARNGDGQGRLMSFFSKPHPVQEKAAEFPKDTPMAAHQDKRLNDYAFATSQTTQESTIRPAMSGILPTLATHRLGSSILAVPKSRTLDDGLNGKAYIFLSSSPPQTESLLRDAEEVIQPATHEAPPVDTKNQFQPAKTMHVTSMQRINTLNAPRKTLGVRRSMNGWANRKVPGFNPPNLARPP